MNTDQIIDSQQQVVEAVAGYKARMEAAGFSPTAAEQLAIQYHWSIIQSGLMLTQKACQCRQ